MVNTIIVLLDQENITNPSANCKFFELFPKHIQVWYNIIKIQKNIEIYVCFDIREFTNRDQYSFILHRYAWSIECFFDSSSKMDFNWNLTTNLLQRKRFFFWKYVEIHILIMFMCLRTPWVRTRNVESYVEESMGIIHRNAEYMSRKTLAIKPIEKWKQCQTLTKTKHIHM